MAIARHSLRTAILLVGALTALACATPPGAAAAPVERGYWETLSQKFRFPAPMDECYSVTVDGIIYVLGGLDTHNESGYLAMGAVWAFDPRTGRWTGKKRMPVPTHHFAITVYRHAIYIFGGFVAPRGQPGGLLVATAWEYDPK